MTGIFRRSDSHKDNIMPSFLKSDLTYSLSGGFILGALALFFMQPVEEQQGYNQYQASTVSNTQQIIS